METQIIAFEGPDGEVRLSPPLFLDNTISVSPADLSQFAPQGNGIYGLQHTDINPFAMGESMEAASGVVFFDIPRSKEDFMGFLRVLGVANSSVPGHDEHNCHYWAFVKESDEPGHDGYLKQMRVVDRFGLKYLYRMLDEQSYHNFPDQPLSLPDFLWLFIQDQVKAYGTTFYSTQLAGKFGGDGDFEREQLSFGLMIENSYHNVYRIWSRAWLVTK